MLCLQGIPSRESEIADLPVKTSCVFLTLAEYRSIQAGLKALTLSTTTGDHRILEMRLLLAEKIDRKVRQLANPSRFERDEQKR